ncbi:Hypothetical_protein [Hexamita inflata]|uniref:Hypothetical_protein n=1 Tax=Hexamita inflata TaxID=28002 RepID=A0AA86UDU5_9EUKA|nr:Hypothetical protein HINF_LOCUS39419 [Hexamita inflata]
MIFIYATCLITQLTIDLGVQSSYKELDLVTPGKFLIQTSYYDTYEVILQVIHQEAPYILQIPAKSSFVQLYVQIISGSAVQDKDITYTVVQQDVKPIILKPTDVLFQQKLQEYNITQCSTSQVGTIKSSNTTNNLDQSTSSTFNNRFIVSDQQILLSRYTQTQPTSYDNKFYYRGLNSANELQIVLHVGPQSGFMTYNLYIVPKQTEYIHYTSCQMFTSFTPVVNQYKSINSDVILSFQPPSYEFQAYVLARICWLDCETDASGYMFYNSEIPSGNTTTTLIQLLGSIQATSYSWVMIIPVAVFFVVLFLMIIVYLIMQTGKKAWKLKLKQAKLTQNNERLMKELDQKEQGNKLFDLGSSSIKPKTGNIQQIRALPAGKNGPKKLNGLLNTSGHLGETMGI